MTTLAENPMPIIFVGILVEAVLATLYVSTKRGAILLAMLGVLILVFVGVGLERMIVTDVERVEATLDGAADALEDNDARRLLEGYVSPSAVATRARAISALQMVEITSAKISSLTITINRLTSPPTAEAQFNGAIRYEPRTEMVPYRYYAARFIVELRLEGDRWLITDHIEYSEL